MRAVLLASLLMLAACGSGVVVDVPDAGITIAQCADPAHPDAACMIDDCSGTCFPPAVLPDGGVIPGYCHGCPPEGQCGGPCPIPSECIIGACVAETCIAIVAPDGMTCDGGICTSGTCSNSQ